MIQRPQYKEWLDEFREKKLIKVLTGLRRAGKSTILEMYIKSLKECGVADERIVSINFEKLEFEPLTDPVEVSGDRPRETIVKRAFPHKDPADVSGKLRP